MNDNDVHGFTGQTKLQISHTLSIGNCGWPQCGMQVLNTISEYWQELNLEVKSKLSIIVHQLYSDAITF